MFRDVAEMPESICPCHNETMELIQEYIDQVNNYKSIGVVYFSTIKL